MKTVPALFLGLCVALLAVSAHAASPEEIQALTDLYNSTNGPHWYRNTNWLRGDPCYYNWYGVMCDANDNILRLTLTSNTLRGSLPESFGQLSNAIQIDLYYNSISGPLPQSIVNLTSVEFLDLSNNKFYGPLPEQIFSLPKLSTLDLGSNSFSGPIPEVETPSPFLWNINLNYNDLSGSVPSWLLNLQDSQISLSSNLIDTIAWDQLSSPKTLSNTTINLSSNFLSRQLPYQVYWYKSIVLDSNIISGTLPSYNTSAPSLIDSFSIDYNYLTGNLPESLTEATYLSSLSVSNNQNMYGVIPQDYATMPYLRSLQFYGTGLDCPSNYAWDNFKDDAYTSCPYSYSSYDDGSLSTAAIVAIYISVIVFLLIIAGLIIFCTVRSPRRIIIAA